MRGDLGAAETAYREASGRGREPQPGLALLRLAQGRVDDARATIARALSEADAIGDRANLLPASVEINLAAGDLEAARAGSRELESIAAGGDGGELAAIAAQARGATEIAEGDPRRALASLRVAEAIWRELGFPFEEARARELVGLACRDLGDEDSAILDLEAARSAYGELGATLDLKRVESRLAREPSAGSALTKRELEVLRHLASGETNRAIAADLVVSERTVDRHVSNVFAKLGVSTRAAATAYAYEHHLL
jgi:DNA-binding CsgD family transcriptional regulator